MYTMVVIFQGLENYFDNWMNDFSVRLRIFSGDAFQNSKITAAKAKRAVWFGILRR